MPVHVDVARIMNQDAYAVHAWYNPYGGGLDDSLHMGSDGEWHPHKAFHGEEPTFIVHGNQPDAGKALMVLLGATGSHGDDGVPAGRLTEWFQRKLRNKLGL